jgi:iron uptake system EfeUOB component EfeO/EfeM
MVLMMRRRLFATVSIGVLAITACSSGASGTGGASSPSAATSVAASAAASAAGTTVDVKVHEWSVDPGASSAPAGSVTFSVNNTGPEDVHEFVILKTDLDPGALPVDATGAVSETGAGIEVVDEIEDIPIGATQEVTATLAAGKYVLLCNIYDETEKEAHYKMGMRIAFTAAD